MLIKLNKIANVLWLEFIIIYNKYVYETIQSGYLYAPSADCLASLKAVSLSDAIAASASVASSLLNRLAGWLTGRLRSMLAKSAFAPIKYGNVAASSLPL